MSSIIVRNPGSIYQIHGEIENGDFHGRWLFSFGEYYDPRFEHFDTLRVFNDDTFSPGAVWPLHPHKDNEVVTYCASGEFRHADERGKGGVLKNGWVQHTTVGSMVRQAHHDITVTLSLSKGWIMSSVLIWGSSRGMTDCSNLSLWTDTN